MCGLIARTAWHIFNSFKMKKNTSFLNATKLIIFGRMWSFPFSAFSWLWKKHLFWSDLQHRIFVPVGLEMDNFCSTLLLFQPHFFPFFFWKIKERGRGGEASKPTKATAHTVNEGRKSGHQGVGGAEHQGWVGRVRFHFHSPREDLTSWAYGFFYILNQWR